MRTPRHPPSLVVRLSAYILISIVLFVAAWQGDAWASQALVKPEVGQQDWCRMLRMAGFLPTWLLAGLALFLVRWEWRERIGKRQALLPPLLLVVSAAASGAVGELVKLLIRRERPEFASAGAYAFRPWTVEYPWSTSGLGLPSSHAIVAFGAAFMLVRLYPRAWPVWLGLALGCAFTRLLEHAHYLSDVTLAAIVAYGVAWGVAAIAHPSDAGPSTDDQPQSKRGYPQIDADKRR